MVGVGGVRMRSYATDCDQCGVPYMGSSSQKFCTDCVDGDAKTKMKQRSAIGMYGVDRQMYAAMYFEQDGKCLICEEREAACIDHCHETGRVRGLLCLGCNTLLGFIETPGRLGAALAYKAEGVY